MISEDEDWSLAEDNADENATPTLTLDVNTEVFDMVTEASYSSWVVDWGHRFITREEYFSVCL